MAERIARLPGDLVQRAFELLVGERVDPAAVVADQMVVVMRPARVNRFVARRARTEVEPLDEAVLRQLLQGPVDARRPDAAALGAQSIEDLLRREAALLPPEQLDDGPPGAAVAAPSRAQHAHRRLRPGTRVGCALHGP